MRLSIDIPDETHRELKAKAAREGTTISEVVRVAVERYLRGDITVAMPTMPEKTTTSYSADYVRPISKADQAKGRSRK